MPHVRENLVPVLHQCRYGHKWEAPMRYGYYYNYPSCRFCLDCLEWGRIEIGSIQLETSGMDGGRIEWECPTCGKRTIIPLPIDLIGADLFREQSLEDMFEKKPRWYHLPERWPTMCEHDLRR